MPQRSSKARNSRRNALRKLTRKVPEGEALFATLFGLADPLLEKSPAKDRTAAIMGATFLEHALRQAICRCLTPDPSDPAFDYLFDSNDAPDRELAGRIRLARALGIVDRWDFDQLRSDPPNWNAFAHTMEDISFATQEIANLFDDIHVTFDSPTLASWLELFSPRHTLLGALPSTHANSATFVYCVSDIFWRLIIWSPSGNPLPEPFQQEFSMTMSLRRMIRLSRR